MCRGPVELEYFEYLVYLAVSAEKCLLLNEFCENATDSPDIDSQAVLSLSKKHLWCSIPQSFNFMGEGLDRDAESSGESEVCNFENS